MLGTSKTAIWISALLLSTVAGAEAITNSSNPRAMGMGGAFTALARGTDAPSWNPANLGLSDRPHISLSLVELGLGAEIDGPSVKTLNDFSGKFLTSADKDQLLDEMADGLKLDFDTEVKLLSLSISTLALNINANAGGNMTIPQDIFDFLLNGNELGKPIQFDQAGGEGIAIASATLAGALPLDVEPFQDFSVGAGVRYYRGLASGVVTNSGGEFVATLDEGMQGHGFATLNRSLGGSGMGVDLGVAGILENDIIVSAGVINLLGGNITWDNETKADSTNFRLTAHYLDEMMDSDSDVAESSDTSYTIGSFSTQLPRIIHVGVAREWRMLTLAFDLEKASARSMGYDSTIRLSAGAELRILPILPLRIGTSFGGADGRSVSFGFGLHLLGFHWDLAMRNRGSLIPTDSDGFSAATGFRFAW